MINFYRSRDSVISSSDFLLGSSSVASIGVGATSSLSRSNIVGEAGTFYYGVCVTGVIGEAATDNNCSAGVVVSAFPITNVYNVTYFDGSIDPFFNIRPVNIIPIQVGSNNYLVL